MHDSSTVKNISLEDVTEELVIEYLCVDKTFFQRHEDLLEELYIPHSTGAAVSLIERQVERLREKNNQLQEEMVETLQIAKDNEKLFEATKALTLRLVPAASIQEIIDIVQETLRHDFKAEFSRIGLTYLPDDISSCPGVFLFDANQHRPLKEFIKTDHAVCKRLHKETANILFSEQAVDVGSSALVPLGPRAKYGILAIGSRDKSHFHKDMDTLFLDFIGKVVGQLISRFC